MDRELKVVQLKWPLYALDEVQVPFGGDFPISGLLARVIRSRSHHYFSECAVVRPQLGVDESFFLLPSASVTINIEVYAQ
jgi:hypothetical protein